MFNMDYKEQAVQVHKEQQGAIQISSRLPLKTKEDLSLAYTPGVGEVSRVIAEDKERVWDLTVRGRAVAVVTDGSAVLGLGNIGPEAAMPVMEGKAVIYKEFAGIEAWPLCLGTQDTEELIKTITHLAPSFGAIHLEDISSPRCFEIEDRLRKELDIPVLHDDQHATAVVILAGLYNALKVVGKEMGSIRVVIAGAGAAGIAAAHLLVDAGVTSIQVFDSRGFITPTRGEGMNPYKQKLVERLFALDGNNYGDNLKAAVKGADVFVGVSQPDLLDENDVRVMNSGSIIFALSNPNPEIMPDEAKRGGVGVMSSGRSDFPNQINNAMVYPGIFRGALEARIHDFTSEMKIHVATAMASIVSEPTADYILPTMFEPGLAEHIAKAVVEFSQL